MHLADATVVITTLSGDESKRCRVEIRSRRAASGWMTHASATLERTTQPPAEPPRSTTHRQPTLDPGRALPAAAQRRSAAWAGVPGHRRPHRLRLRCRSRRGPVAVAGQDRARGGSLLHPVMVDIALQALGATKAATDLAARETDDATVVLPVRLAGVRVYGDVTEGVAAIGSLAADRPSGPLRRPGDAHRCRRAGASGHRRDRHGGAARAGSRRASSPSRHVHPGLGTGGSRTSRRARWTLCCWSVMTHRRSAARGAVIRGPVSMRTYRRADRRVPTRRELRDALTRKDVAWNAIVVVCPPRAVDEALTDTEQLELAQSRTLLVADIVKTLSQIGARNSPRLWIVTRGAQQLDAGERVTLAQTTLRGIARVLTFEHPELKTTIVDVDADGDRLGHCADQRTCLPMQTMTRWPCGTGTALCEPRWCPRPPTPAGELAVEPRRTVVDLDGTGAVRLQIDQPGRLDALTVHAVQADTAAGRPGRDPSRGRGAQLQRRAQDHGRLPRLGRQRAGDRRRVRRVS